MIPIDPYLLAGIIIFVAGYLLLRRTNSKRYIIFFMLETKRGLNFVDRVARLFPGLWKFAGDVAIVVSFGGIGAYYVSRYRNTWFIAFLLGLASVLFSYLSLGLWPSVFAFVLLCVAVFILRKIEKPFAHLILSTAIMGFLMFLIFPSLGGTALMRPVIAVLVGIFGMPALLICMLFSQAAKIIVENSPIPGVSPLLPTVSSEGPGFFFPGTGIFIPLWQAVIAIVLLLVPHEFAHGLLARTHKIRLKSSGILTAGPLPIGAFVEPDDKSMRMHRGRDRMRVYAVGSFANLLVAIASILILVTILAPAVDMMTEKTGMVVTNAVNGSPAYGVLQGGFIIKDINGIPTPDAQTFNSVVSGLKPNQTVTFVTTNGTFNITLAARSDNASRGYIGIDLRESFDIKQEFKTKYLLQAETVLFTTSTLFWVFFLSFNIALVNLLPIVPFDGGKMFEEMMTDFRVRRKRKELIIHMVIFLIVALLLLNALPLFKLLG